MERWCHCTNWYLNWIVNEKSLLMGSKKLHRKEKSDWKTYSYFKIFHWGRWYVHIITCLSSLLSGKVHRTSWESYSLAICIFTIPCLRTSSTAAVSSSFRNWLSFAIFSPFSRKFWVAVSTEAANTWAFLERPFFLLDGPLLLELTKVVTYGRDKRKKKSSAKFRSEMPVILL